MMERACQRSPPLPLAGISIGMERGRQQSDRTLAKGSAGPPPGSPSAAARRGFPRNAKSALTGSYKNTRWADVTQSLKRSSGGALSQCAPARIKYSGTDMWFGARQERRVAGGCTAFRSHSNSAALTPPGSGVPHQAGRCRENPAAWLTAAIPMADPYCSCRLAHWSGHLLPAGAVVRAEDLIRERRPCSLVERDGKEKAVP